MKRFVAIALFLALAPAAQKQSFKVHVSTVAWQPLDLPGVPKGLEQRLLHDNKAKSMVSAVVKFPKGFREPRHYHTTCGHSMYILRGRLRSPEGDLTPGTFIYAAAKEPHGPFTAIQETEFIFYTDGPLDFFVEDVK